MNSKYKVLFFDPDTCTGCCQCAMACGLKHEGYVSLIDARNEIIRQPDSGKSVNMSCRQCATPVCEAVCPQRAISRDGVTGAMVINEDFCIGCQSCVIACPIGGISKNLGTGKIIKCNLCEGNPECVKYCAYGAIEYLSMREAQTKKQKKAIYGMIQFDCFIYNDIDIGE